MRTPSTSANPLRWGATAREAESTVSASSTSARRELQHGVGRERLTADAPVAALDLLDDDPGHPAHVLALDLDHGVGQLLDHRILLRVVEDTLDHLHVHQRHVVLRFSWSFDRSNVR